MESRIYHDLHRHDRSTQSRFQMGSRPYLYVLRQLIQHQDKEQLGGLTTTREAVLGARGPTKKRLGTTTTDTTPTTTDTTPTTTTTSPTLGHT
ncbi:unnamed protein product [Bursaphelenchus okinawaensis]|uniref:Uncharacterized protein n=1 Tax=Bursaphelenchus okinawaensis TaxID=465554 RepID=A0A811LL66_9BILA|nr:unnamed protein product [Bursaphelenchus okinawaensis]CAG9123736.1 unnamed protein product [Bursaphelenchus okinawaensis]